MIRTLLLAAVGLSLSACGFTRGATPATPVGPIPSELTGTVSSRERIALAPDTQLRVRLEEISGGEAPPQFIAETTIPRIGQPPVRFRIALDPGVIDAKRRSSGGSGVASRIGCGMDEPVRTLLLQ